MQRTGRGGRIALALALLAPFVPARAAPEGARATSPFGTPVFSAVGARGGLPGSSASCIAQDSRGFIWLGTGRGLVRYDGASFRLFSHEPFDAGSLVEDSVRAVYAESDAIWVGTEGGLARLDLKTERFASFSEESGRADSLSSDVVTSITRDGRGALWVGTIAGLNRLDESTGRFKRFLHDPADSASLPSNDVAVLKVDREGRLWIGGAGMDLVRFDRERGTFVPYRDSSSVQAGGSARDASTDYVTAMDEDSSGKLWLGRASGGVSLLDPQTGRMRSIPIGETRVDSICASDDGVVFVGTRGGGLVEYSGATGRALRYRASAVPGSLAGNDVSALLRDQVGDLWIGTEGGPCMLSRELRGCETIAAGEGGMPAGDISAVLVDGRGRLWAGSRGGGIARREASTGSWRRYRHGGGIPPALPDDAADFLREDGRGIVWAGIGGFLARYDEGTDSFIPARIAGSGSVDSSMAVSAMVDDPSGGAWIGTPRSGLVYWDRASGKTLRYRRENGRADSLSGDAVTALCMDSSGRLWVGTDRGLDRLEVERGEGGAPAAEAHFVAYRYDPANPRGISSDSIRTIFLDSYKVLWIGSGGGGLMRYEPETDSFVSYAVRNGLPGNVVQSMLEDASGNLWIATGSGLAFYDRAVGRLRPISIGGGAGQPEFFPGAASAPDGMLFFGSADRLLRIDPAKFKFNDHRPPVVLASVSVRGMPPLGAAALAGLDRLALPRGEGSVSFEFAALDFRAPERNLYSHRLEGFEADWSAPGRDRSAVYTNLPRGDYVFRVKASNGDGLWNEEGLALRLRVRRRAWASPLAMVIYALLLAGGGYLATRSVLGASLSSLRSEVERLRAKLVAASAAIESAAIVDPLTGLPNRRKIEEHLELALSRAAQSKLDVAVLMVDIDHFKSYNDRFGKAAGDECLRSVARAISACVRRSSDVVARYGGEEFLVVMERTSIMGALSEAETVRRAVEALGAVTASVGCVSTEPDAERSPAALIAAVERALMAAKMLGRNRTSV